jgi:hypothetical protein
MLKAAVNAGLSVSRYEWEAGKITVFTGNAPIDDLDRELAELRFGGDQS